MSGSTNNTNHAFRLVEGKVDARRASMERKQPKGSKEERVEKIRELFDAAGISPSSKSIVVEDAKMALRAVADLCINGVTEQDQSSLEGVACRDMSALLRVISRSLETPA